MDSVAEDFVRYRSRGDVAALARVFDALAPQLLSLGLHLCGHAADAEDALQATFVVAMRKAESFDASQPLASWLAGILAGEARNLARRAGRRRAAPLDDVVGGDSDPAALAERRDLVQQLRTRIDALPEEQRQALLLQLEHGLQPAEIAEVVGASPGTVRMRLHRGLRALRRLLPAGLAIGIAGLLPARGLAAVRRAVLVEGRSLAGAGTAGAGLVVGAGIAMKLLLVGVGCVVLAALVWFAAPWAAAPTSPGGVSPGAGVADAPRAASSGAGPARVEALIAEARTPVVGPAGSVLVRVRFAGTGEPVPGVEVHLHRPPPDAVWSRELPTDVRGEVRFERVPAGELRFDCSPGGRARVKLPSGGYTFVRSPRRTVEVPADGEVVLEHELPLGGIVVGRAVDDAGAPVGGAEILTTGSPDIGHVRSELWRTIGHSAADGSFCVGLVRNEMSLAARAAGYATSATHVLEPDPDRDAAVTLVLPRTCGRLSGFVRDGAGTPLSGVSVTLAGQWSSGRAPDGAELRPSPPRNVTTGADGAFVFSDLACAPHRLFVESRVAGHAIVPVSIQPGRTVTQDVVLGRPATLRCIVRDREGRPVPEALVRVEQEEVPDAREQHTDVQGCCEFAQLAPGRVRMRAVRSGIGAVRTTLLLRDGQRVERELVLAPSPAILGRLVGEDGRGLRGWNIAAVDETWRPSSRAPAAPEDTTTSGDGGAFEIVDLQSGSYRLLAWPPGAERGLGAVALAERVAPGSAPQTFVVSAAALPTASLRGVVLGPDLRPCDGVVLLLTRRDVAGRRRGASVETRDDGVFAFESLLPGPYRLQVLADEFAAVPAQELRLAAREQRDLGSTRLCTGTRIVVRVLGADGEPWPHKLPDVRVERTDADGTVHQRGGFVAAGGVLRSPLLPPGRVRLVVQDDNLVAWPVEVDVVADQETEVELQVTAGTLRHFRFELPEDANRMRLEARDEHGHVLRSIAEQLRGIRAMDMRLALLAGSWTVTGADDLGNRYYATVEIGDLRPDDTRIVMQR